MRMNTDSGRLARALLVLTALLLSGCATSTPYPGWEAMGGSGDGPGADAGCAAQPLPPGWPDSSSEDTRALLEPFLSCSSPTDFLALQQRVDMSRLVERLDAWSAVRLGALGPVHEDAAGPLNHQRTAFLLQSLERYGPAYTEVLARFVLDSSHDDDLRDILFLLAQDKRLVELLEALPSLGPALEARGFKPSAHAERGFQWGDVARGLGRAGKEALATSPMVNGAQSTLMEFAALQAQLPPSYQQALDAVTQELRDQQFSADRVMLGVVDHMTFGVPLGFYGLVVGTGHGVQSLARGRYEHAVRELAPAAVLVALYAGGRGTAWLSEARVSPGVGMRALSGLEVVEARVRSLQDRARQVRGLLGEDGLRELAGYIRARRDAGPLVAVGGMDAALALHETRGDVGRAQAMLSKARRGATGAARPGGAVELPGSLASWVDEGAGLTQELVRVRLEAAELESTGPRLPRDVNALEKQRPSLEAPPFGAEGNPRWSEYVSYYGGRIEELREGKAAEGPLRWEGYEQMRGWFARGLAFERVMVKVLKADAALPRARRRFLGAFERPRIETNVGVMKPGPGLRYADVLVIEEEASLGRPRRVETLSFKSRDFSKMKSSAFEAQVLADAREALGKYGETLDIRRDSLQPLLREGSSVPVERIRLVYEGSELLPKGMRELSEAVDAVKKAMPGVEVLFQ